MNPYFIQPPRIPPLDEETQEQIKQLTKEDMEKIRNSDVVQKILEERKRRREFLNRNRRKEWFWIKGVVIIDMFLSLIAAITGIIALFR